LLSFLAAKSCAGRRRADSRVRRAVLMIILRLVAKLAVVIKALQENAVLRSYLGFPLQRTRELLQVIVHPPTAFISILHIRRVTHRPPRAELRAPFQTITVTQILRVRTEPQMILLEQPRILLL